MAAPNTYQIDTEVQLSCQFTSLLNGQPIDPSIVNLYITDPNGATTEYSYPTNITRTGVGAYLFQWLPTLSGVWIYKFQGAGSVIVTSVDQPVIIASSIPIPG